MIERSYFCDLCREKNTMLIGLYWEADGHLILKRETHNLEHHICMDCYRAIHDSTMWQPFTGQPVPMSPRSEGPKIK